MAETRWDRLKADLLAAGYDVRVDSSSYPGGVSKSVTYQMPNGLVTIIDAWWSKNADVWLGWSVAAEGADSIIIGRPALSKKRSETVAAFRTAVTKVA